VVGPNGSVTSMGGGDASWQIGFNVSAPDLQSPPYEMIIEDFVLPPPSGPATVGSGGSNYTVEGGAETSGSGSMNVRVRLVDDDLLFNDTLVDLSPSLSIPSNSFDDAVIPYSFSSGFNLFLNGSGDIAGAAGSSGDTSIDLFQELVDMGLLNTNITSSIVTVTAAP